MLSTLSPRRACALSLSFSLFFFSALPSAVTAQDSPAPEAEAVEPVAAAAEEPVDPTDALTAQVGRLETEIRELAGKIEAAEGEDRIVLLAQSSERQDELSRQLDDLLEQIEADRRNGISREDAERFAQDVVDTIFVRLGGRIDDSFGSITALRTRHDAAPAVERIELEQQLGDLNEAHDTLLGVWFRNCLAHERLGESATEELARLDSWLAERAEATSTLARITRVAVQRLEYRASGLDEEEPGTNRAELALQRYKLDTAVATLRRTIDLMEDRGLETAELRGFLIGTTGKISEDIFDREVASGLLGSWAESARAWVVEATPLFVFRTVLFIGILLVFRILAGVARRMVRGIVSSSRVQTSRLLDNFLISTSYRFVLLIGLLMAVSQERSKTCLWYRQRF